MREVRFGLPFFHHVGEMSKGVFHSGVKRSRAHGTEQLVTGKIMAKGGAVKEG